MKVEWQLRLVDKFLATGFELVQLEQENFRQWVLFGFFKCFCHFSVSFIGFIAFQNFFYDNLSLKNRTDLFCIDFGIRA